jgi:hypothetical protein
MCFGRLCGCANSPRDFLSVVLPDIVAVISWTLAKSDFPVASICEGQGLRLLEVDFVDPVPQLSRKV